MLTVDVKNLDSAQKTNTINFNALTQSLFKDAAEENARQQFNAKNQLQVDNFFAELEAQVETANNTVAAPSTGSGALHDCDFNYGLVYDDSDV